MVFSSLPIYLDPPNWQQQHNHGTGSETQNPPQLPTLPQPSHVGTGSIRPGSMSDRARLAKIPQPEASLKCPRCESTNTKFCYFNNYSLSQPRHFCKTCRRYWTRGGALRSVPVGGGCRRNKKNKSSTSTTSSSKSTPSTEKQGGSNSNPNSTNAAINPSEIITPHHFPFMGSLQNFPHFGLGNLGLNFSGIQGETTSTAAAASGQAEMGFHIGTNSGMSSASILSSGGGTDHQRHQQFPFFDPNNGLYSFQSHHEGIVEGSSSRVSQVAPVKMENNNNNQGLNLSRSVMGVSENNQYWGGNNWTDLSSLNSFNTNHLL